MRFLLLQVVHILFFSIGEKVKIFSSQNQCANNVQFPKFGLKRDLAITQWGVKPCNSQFENFHAFK